MISISDLGTSTLNDSVGPFGVAVSEIEFDRRLIWRRLFLSLSLSLYGESDAGAASIVSFVPSLFPPSFITLSRSLIRTC